MHNMSAHKATTQRKYPPPWLELLWSLNICIADSHMPKYCKTFDSSNKICIFQYFILFLSQFKLWPWLIAITKKKKKKKKKKKNRSPASFQYPKPVTKSRIAFFFVFIIGSFGSAYNLLFVKIYVVGKVRFFSYLFLLLCNIYLL